MQTLPGLCVVVSRPVLTQFVLDWLNHSQRPRILHVFERACNLINEQDEMISLVWPELGAGPFALVLAEERPFTNIETGTIVNITKDTLYIGDLIVPYDRAVVWQPRLDWTIIQQRQTNWSKIRPLLLQIMAQENPSKPDVEPSHRLAPTISTKLSLAQQAFIAGIEKGNVEQIERGVQQLAGLGQGLTPTGDDFLVGAMLALWATGHYLEWINLIVQTAVPRTTLLSGAWLRAAGRGEAVAVWHDFFTGLTNGRWETAVHEILQIGHSSGYDALVGFTAVLRLFASEK